MRRAAPLLGAAAALLLSSAALARQPVAERLGDRIVRFHASADAAKTEVPSILVGPAPSLGPAPADFPITPRSSSADNAQVWTIDIPAGTSLYGAGAAAGPLLRSGQVLQTWNPDAPQSPAYPWVLAVRPDGTAFGVLAGTASTIDLTSGIVFKAAGPPCALIAIDRDSPLGVVQALADLTGHMEMPPLWALGYQHPGRSYDSQARVREAAAELRKRQLPCDAIWLDLPAMREQRAFTVDPTAFPDPAALSAELRAQGFHLLARLDPAIRAEPGFGPYDSGSAIDAWVQKPDGSVFQGRAGPGMCVFPDFTRGPVRQWWAGLCKDFVSPGIDGLWTPASEPVLPDAPSHAIPDDTRHRADADLGGPGPHARYRALSGRFMIQATRDGIAAAGADRRPFVLGPATSLGGQRSGAAWVAQSPAGAPRADEPLAAALNLGLSGQPWVGADLGGPAADTPRDAGQEGTLLARSLGIAALLPLARGAAPDQGAAKEPWAYGEMIERSCRRAVERRYHLLPYLYTLLHEASTLGSPIVRPVFMADPKDPALRSEDESFLLGPDVLVAPRPTPDRPRTPARPKGLWRQFGFDDTRDPNLPALFLRGGAILPAGPVQQFATQHPPDEVSLVVCLDETGKARGTLYEDAGDGWGYKTGQYRLTTFAAQKIGQQFTLRVADVQGGLPPLDRRLTARVLVTGMEVGATGTERTGATAIVIEPVTRPRR